jgi:O-antigen/teichoic acid export membrane protein
MEKAASIKKNFLYNISYQMVSALIPIILTPYIARVLTANGVGISSYVTANVTYFQLFSFLGIAGHGQREIAIVRNDKQKVSRIFWELQLFHFLCGAIVLVVYLAFVAMVPSKDVRIYYILNIIMVVASILDISWLYQGFECFRNIAIKNVIAKGSMVLFCLLFVKTENDLWKYILINALGLLASSAFLWKEL